MEFMVDLGPVDPLPVLQFLQSILDLVSPMSAKNIEWSNDEDED